MQGYLFGDHLVELHPETHKVGGAWQGDPRNGRPCAWDQESVAFFKDRMFECGQGAVVLDVGANTGSFCLIPALGGCFTVFAFEPQNDLWGILLENIRLNRLRGIVYPYHYALSNECKRRSLRVPTGEGESGLATLEDNSPWLRGYKEQETRTIVFDEIFKLHRLDLIKTDTEGHDAHVLRGMEAHLLKYRPHVMLENWPGDEAWRYLESIGYNHRKRVGKDNYWATV